MELERVKQQKAAMEADRLADKARIEALERSLKEANQKPATVVNVTNQPEIVVNSAVKVVPESLTQEEKKDSDEIKAEPDDKKDTDKDSELEAVKAELQQLKKAEEQRKQRDIMINKLQTSLKADLDKAI